MYASKENAKKAREAVLYIKGMLDDEFCNDVQLIDGVKLVEQFLVAAERKLPSEASYRREESQRAVAKVVEMETASPKRGKRLANG